MEINSQTPQTSPKKSYSLTFWIVLIIVFLVAIALAVYAYWNKNQNGNTNANQNTNVVVNTNTDLNKNTVANINSTTNVNTNTAINLNTNTTVNMTGWQTYENSDYGISFKHPKDWIVATSVNNNLLHITLLKGEITLDDIRDPWSRLYDNQSYIEIGVQKTKVAGWEFASSLGQEVSHIETQIPFDGISVTQSTSVGYNHGIGDQLFPNNSIPQLMSQIVYNDTKYIYLRLFTGGDIRTSALQILNSIAGTFSIR